MKPNHSIKGHWRVTRRLYGPITPPPRPAESITCLWPTIWAVPTPNLNARLRSPKILERCFANARRPLGWGQLRRISCRADSWWRRPLTTEWPGSGTWPWERPAVHSRAIQVWSGPSHPTGQAAGGVGLQRQHGQALGRGHGNGARYDQGLLGLGRGRHPEERARFRRQREAEHPKVLIAGRQH